MRWLIASPRRVSKHNQTASIKFDILKKVEMRLQGFSTTIDILSYTVDGTFDSTCKSSHFANEWMLKDTSRRPRLFHSHAWNCCTREQQCDWPWGLIKWKPLRPGGRDSLDSVPFLLGRLLSRENCLEALAKLGLAMAVIRCRPQKSLHQGQVQGTPLRRLQLLFLWHQLQHNQKGHHIWQTLP